MAYENTGNWSWLYYPPPYDFLGPSNPAPMPAPILGGGRRSAGTAGLAGLGCGDTPCGGSCCGGHKSETIGLGLFEAGADYTQWGLGEWGVIAMGFYIAGSIIGDTGRGARKVGRVRRALRA